MMETKTNNDIDYKTLLIRVANVLDAEMTLDLSMRSLEMDSHWMFEDSLPVLEKVENEIGCARHSLHLRMLSMLHSVLSEALNGGGDDGNEDK